MTTHQNWYAVSVPRSDNSIGNLRMAFCNENFGRQGLLWLVLMGELGFLIYKFENEEDATLFKLRFG